MDFTFQLRSLIYVLCVAAKHGKSRYSKWENCIITNGDQMGSESVQKYVGKRQMKEIDLAFIYRVYIFVSR